MKIELLSRFAPRHVGTTLYLTRLGFYDGLLFHRIIPGFMVQVDRKFKLRFRKVLS